MRRVISVDRWSAALLAALGLAACGGKTSWATASGGGAGTGGSGGQGSKFPCVNPQPIVVADMDTGYDRCQGGFIRRRKVVECPSLLPRTTACSGGAGCTSDADCTAQPLGYCGQSGMMPCECNYGCRTDADCGAGEICLCGDPLGTCVPATCTSNASCAKGFQCTSYRISPCGGVGFSCQAPGDTCGSISDCDQTAQCGSNGTNHVCVPGLCTE